MGSEQEPRAAWSSRTHLLGRVPGPQDTLKPLSPGLDQTERFLGRGNGPFLCPSGADSLEWPPGRALRVGRRPVSGDQQPQPLLGVRPSTSDTSPSGHPGAAPPCVEGWGPSQAEGRKGRDSTVLLGVRNLTGRTMARSGGWADNQVRGWAGVPCPPRHNPPRVSPPPGTSWGQGRLTRWGPHRSPKCSPGSREGRAEAGPGGEGGGGGGPSASGPGVSLRPRPLSSPRLPRGWTGPPCPRAWLWEKAALLGSERAACSLLPSLHAPLCSVGSGEAGGLGWGEGVPWSNPGV